MAINEDLDLWLKDRARTARILQFANYRYASRLTQWNTYSGLAIAVLTTAAGTTALTDLSSAWGPYVVAVLSAMAAILTATRTAAKWGDTAAQHRKAAQTYGSLRFEIEKARALNDLGCDAREFSAKITKRLSEADVACPDLPERWYDKGKAHVAERQNQSLFATAA